MKRQTELSPFGAVAKGKLAGAFGTAAMDVVWYSRHRLGGGDEEFMKWEFAGSVKDWSEAPAPAQFGKRIAEKALRRELPATSAAVMTNVVHWSTGLGWGGLYGLAARSSRFGGLVPGLVFGTAVWATSYVVLPLVKIYEPIWEYDAETLFKDLTAHWAFGVTTASTFRLLTGR